MLESFWKPFNTTIETVSGACKRCTRLDMPWWRGRGAVVVATIDGTLPAARWPALGGQAHALGASPLPAYTFECSLCAPRPADVSLEKVIDELNTAVGDQLIGKVRRRAACQAAPHPCARHRAQVEPPPPLCRSLGCLPASPPGGSVLVCAHAGLG